MLKTLVKWFKAGFAGRARCLGERWGHCGSVTGTAWAGAAGPVPPCPCAPSPATPPELLLPLIPGQGRSGAAEGGQCHGPDLAEGLSIKTQTLLNF